MNEHDRKNLEFLLKAAPETIRDWAGKMESDDILYAQELLLAAAADLRERSREILVEAEMARSDRGLAEVSAYLKKFQLRG